mmetsp:Transcript_5151/g.17976  ORF Transcript_5151/g.17976 Transcript_5151/m.17976 type:complete len:215 (+) Transcript_5151:234-878(+)
MTFRPLVLSLLLLATAVGPSSSIGPVKDVNDNNFDETVAQNPTFLVVMATWCSHCKALKPVWEQLGAELRESGVTVAKVNGPEAKALSQRLDVKSYPSIFYFRGGRAYEYTGHRGLRQLAHFASEGYLEASPIPFWKSPVSPVGRALGWVFRLPSVLQNAYDVAKKEGHTQWLIAIAVAVPVICALAFVFAIDRIASAQGVAAAAAAATRPHQN